MTHWDPATYLRFADARMRPAVELLARIFVNEPADVVDLGCGTGNSTAILAQRWPHAAITGIDSSAEMLARARQDLPRATWQRLDIAAWQPDEQVDVLFSNAALHWLDDHEQLFPRLLAAVRPRGALAVQMPANFSQATHTMIATAIGAGPWRDRLEPLLRPPPVHAARDYIGWLTPHATSVDVWSTTYVQVLRGDNPVAEWCRGAALRPFLSACDDDDERAAFFAAYAERVAAAYPQRDDGSTLLPFTRRFVVAHAKDA